MKQKFISFIIFLTIFNLVFPKISLGQEDYYYEYYESCTPSISYVPSNEVPYAIETILSSGGYKDSLVLKDLRKYGNIYEAFKNESVVILHPVPPQPPDYDEAYIPVYTFQGRVLEVNTTTNKTKVRLIESFQKDPLIKYIDMETVYLMVAVTTTIEDFYMQKRVYEDCSVNYYLTLIDREQSSAQSYTEEEYSSTIVYASQPYCYTKKKKSLTKTKVTLKCTINALAMNGMVGDGYYKKSKSSWGGYLGFIIGIVVRVIVFFVAPPLGLIEPALLESYLISGGAGLIAKMTVDSILNNNLPKLRSVVVSKSFGTVEKPAGGLEQFSWNWYGGFPVFDLSVTSLDIRTFICKNKNFDLSYLNEYLSKNPNYMFAPSTTYAEKFYNEVAKNTCPESQRNRPVEFSAEGICLQGRCPKVQLKISIKSDSPPTDQETKEFETSYDSSYPKSIKGEYIFNKPYNYKVSACFIGKKGKVIKDANNSNNCKEETIRIFDYMCTLGFCAQNQRDIENPSPVFNFEPLMYKILKVFGDTDSPCRFWRNEICRAGFSF